MLAGGIMAATGAAMPNNIDPLAYEEDLTKAGVPAKQAHVHAEAIGKVKDQLGELDNRFKFSVSEGRVEQELAELNTKIDRTKVELEAKIDKTRANLEEKIQRAKLETFLWTAGIVISAFGVQSYVIANMLK
jgi:uncharacterized protein YjbJ (UPF0337 family)